MPFLVFAVSMLISLSIAASPSPFVAPPKSGPICFTPPDRHPVSTVIRTCDTLLSNFVDSYRPSGAIRRWTSNSSEVGPNVVHLPKVEYLINRNRTEACLVEVLDPTGVGDSFPATEVQDSGKAILNECFRNNKCGIIPLAPDYITSVAVCGSYHGLNATECKDLTRASHVAVE
ncbi:hypothetical protein ACLMJK_001932 [Lecanora helva]